MMHPWAVRAAGVCAAALAFLPLPTLPGSQPTYNVAVNVVNVLATVRDGKGRIVNNLTKDDFILEEEGTRQEIRYFSRQTDLALTVGLLVDTSMSQRDLIETERRASYQFLDQVLRPDKDVAFVIHFATEVELLQDLTGSRPLLEAALEQLQTPHPALRRLVAGGWFQWPGGRRPRIPGTPPRGPGRSGPGRARIGTALYDAVYLAAEEVLLMQTGRKAVILISDGVDAGSKISQRDAIKAALGADTIVYSVRYFDQNAYSGLGGRAAGNRGAEALTAISSETGGRMFEVSKRLTLAQIYDQIQEELRNQYSLGYNPPEVPSPGYRRITLTTKDSKLKVQARQGYYAKPG